MKLQLAQNCVICDLGPVSRKSRNLPGPVSIFLNVFFADYTVITDMVLGQCVYRIIRFRNLVFKANKN